jgi:hypothetical protein
MVNAPVYEKLVQVAKARKTIPYGDLAKVADVLVESSDDMKILGLILDQIADQEVAEGRPLLPVVVVGEASNMPGAGLYRYAKRKGLQKTDDLTFFAAELKRVHDYWALARKKGH